MMTKDEQRIVRLVQEVDRERTARLKAERSARILKTVIAQMRRKSARPRQSRGASDKRHTGAFSGGVAVVLASHRQLRAPVNGTTRRATDGLRFDSIERRCLWSQRVMDVEAGGTPARSRHCIRPRVSRVLESQTRSVTIMLFNGTRKSLRSA
jgi:hypothetical protein